MKKVLVFIWSTITCLSDQVYSFDKKFLDIILEMKIWNPDFNAITDNDAIYLESFMNSFCQLPATASNPMSDPSEQLSPKISSCFKEFSSNFCSQFPKSNSCREYFKRAENVIHIIEAPTLDQEKTSGDFRRTLLNVYSPIFTILKTAAGALGNKQHQLTEAINGTRRNKPMHSIDQQVMARMWSFINIERLIEKNIESTLTKLNITSDPNTIKDLENRLFLVLRKIKFLKFKDIPVSDIKAVMTLFSSLYPKQSSSYTIEKFRVNFCPHFNDSQGCDTYFQRRESEEAKPNAHTIIPYQESQSMKSLTKVEPVPHITRTESITEKPERKRDKFLKSVVKTKNKIKNLFKKTNKEKEI